LLPQTRRATFFFSSLRSVTPNTIFESYLLPTKDAGLSLFLPPGNTLLAISRAFLFFPVNDDLRRASRPRAARRLPFVSPDLFHSSRFVFLDFDDAQYLLSPLFFLFSRARRLVEEPPFQGAGNRPFSFFSKMADLPRFLRQTFHSRALFFLFFRFSPTVFFSFSPVRCGKRFPPLGAASFFYIRSSRLGSICPASWSRHLFFFPSSDLSSFLHGALAAPLVPPFTALLFFFFLADPFFLL